MIDTLEDNREKAYELEIEEIIERNLIDGQSINSKLQTPSSKEDLPTDVPQSPTRSHANSYSRAFALMTMHRPSNVDEKQILEPLFNFLNDQVATDMPLIWPIHPRSQKRLQEFGLWEKALNSERLILLHPVDYHEMLRLNMDARLMLTDSGGLQEECCVL